MTMSTFNDYFRNKIIYLDRETNQLKIENRKLKEMAAEMDVFKVSIVLSSEDRDAKMDDVQKTAEQATDYFDREAKKLEKQKHDLEKCFEDLKDFKYSTSIFDRERDADLLYLKEIAEICVKSEAFKAATATSKQN